MQGGGGVRALRLGRDGGHGLGGVLWWLDGVSDVCLLGGRAAGLGRRLFANTVVFKQD